MEKSSQRKNEKQRPVSPSRLQKWNNSDGRKSKQSEWSNTRSIIAQQKESQKTSSRNASAQKRAQEKASGQKLAF